jgi:hypothetical protein
LLMLKKTPESPPKNDVLESVTSTIRDAPVIEFDGTTDTPNTDASSVTEDESFVPESPPKSEISGIGRNTISDAPVKDANVNGATNKDAPLVKEEASLIKEEEGYV